MFFLTGSAGAASALASASHDNSLAILPRRRLPSRSNRLRVLVFALAAFHSQPADVYPFQFAVVQVQPLLDVELGSVLSGDFPVVLSRFLLANDSYSRPCRFALGCCCPELALDVAHFSLLPAVQVHPLHMDGVVLFPLAETTA